MYKNSYSHGMVSGQSFEKLTPVRDETDNIHVENCGSFLGCLISCWLHVSDLAL